MTVAEGALIFRPNRIAAWSLTTWVGLCCIVVFLGGTAQSQIKASAAHETRRAFVVGVQAYTDPEIQSLERSDTDAGDVASDLEELGFDKKNVTLAKDVHTKA